VIRFAKRPRRPGLRQGVGGLAAQALRERLKQPFALGFLARDLSGATNRLGPLAGTSFAGLLEMLPELHFAEDAFTLHLFFQGAERLIDIILANANLHVAVTTFPLSELHPMVEVS